MKVLIVMKKCASNAIKSVIKLVTAPKRTLFCAKNVIMLDTIQKDVSKTGKNQIARK
jgi:hypothetical protein